MLFRSPYNDHMLGLKHPRYPVAQGQRVLEGQRSSEIILHHIETNTARAETITTRNILTEQKIDD
jgi:hypothetical protein